MAKIIDSEAISLKRFRAFAEEYLVIPKELETEPTVLMAILLDKNVFTLDEIRREMIKRKILLPERVFRNALEVAKRFRERETQAPEQNEY